jgi:hypothetical protein
MDVTTPHFRMVDRMLDGHLETFLRERRAAGMSWEEMARRLYAEQGIPISGATIRNWGKQLGIPEPQTRAAS